MDIVIRAAAAFIILWLATRAAGRSTLGELSSFELVLFVVLGDLVQQGITMEDRSLVGSLLAGHIGSQRQDFLLHPGSPVPILSAVAGNARKRAVPTR